MLCQIQKRKQTPKDVGAIMGADLVVVVMILITIGIIMKTEQRAKRVM